jgi:hypothetical protein
MCVNEKQGIHMKVLWKKWVLGTYYPRNASRGHPFVVFDVSLFWTIRFHLLQFKKSVVPSQQKMFGNYMCIFVINF